jgi:hypothetical protein
MPRAPQRPPDRHAQFTSQIVSLVESAPQPPPGMQGNRHDRVRAIQHVRAGISQPTTQWPRQRAPAAVLERMQQLAKHALVTPGTAGDFKRRRPGATAIAEAR